jgi:hypothetical protein
VVEAVAIVRPETVIRWHRQSFRAFWRSKSRSRGGRPAIPRDIRDPGLRARFFCCPLAIASSVFTQPGSICALATTFTGVRIWMLCGQASDAEAAVL